MIEKLFVKKLFGIFDNEINFRDGGITIINDENEKFLEYFMSRMHLNKTERDDVRSKINLLLKENYANEYICNGHDLINILWT